MKVSDENFYRLMFLCFLGSLYILASFLVPVVAYIGLAFFFVVAVFTKGIAKFYILLFTLPFYNVFRCSREQTTFCAYLMAFVIVLILIEYIVEIIKKQKSIKMENLIFFGVLILFFVLPIGKFSIMNSMRLELGILLVFLCLEYKNELDFKQIVFSLFLGFALSCVLNPIRYFNPHLSEFLTPFYSYIGNMYRFCGLAFDPNYFSVEVILLITCFTQLYMQDRINYVFYPVILFLLAVGVLTVSKSFFIVFVLYAILSTIGCIIKYKSTDKARKLLITFIVLGICSLAILGRFIRVILDRFTNLSAIDINGNDSKLNHITTGRSDLWVMYLKYWLKGGLKCILFGFGNGQPYLTTYEGTQAMHSLYIEVLYHFGIIGFVMFFGLVVYSIVRYCIKNKVNYFNFIPLVCVLVVLFSINSFISYRPAYLIVVLMFSFTECFTGQKLSEVKVKKSKNRKGENNETINNNTSI